MGNMRTFLRNFLSPFMIQRNKNKNFEYSKRCVQCTSQSRNHGRSTTRQSGLEKQEFGQFYRDQISPKKSCQGSLTRSLCPQEPIEIDHCIQTSPNQTKHMASKHSYWLELNYFIQIQNHLFRLLSEEPLCKDESWL